MAKVLEGPGMGLLRKWGISTPNYVVVTSNDEFEELSKVNDWLQKNKLVVKAHEALGSRFKLGLVKVGLDLAAAKSAVKDMLGKQLESVTIREVIVSEAIDHKEEYYASVKSTREGVDVMVTTYGGVKDEDLKFGNWDSATRTFTPGVNPVNAANVTLRRAEANANAAPAFFGQIFGSRGMDIVVSATATPGGPTPCLLSLDPDEPDALADGMSGFGTSGLRP